MVPPHEPEAGIAITGRGRNHGFAETSYHIQPIIAADMQGWAVKRLKRLDAERGTGQSTVMTQDVNQWGCP